MADKGLSEYTEDYCLTRCDFNLCKDRNCDSVKWLKKNIPEIKLQTLEDVEKALPIEHALFRGAKQRAEALAHNDCLQQIKDIIKNLREA
jgi:hypothetical protein